MSGQFKRFDDTVIFDFPSKEERQCDSRQGRDITVSAVAQDSPDQRRSGRPRRNPVRQRAAMFVALSGRLRFDPYTESDVRQSDPVELKQGHDLPLRVIESPNFFIFVVIEAPAGTPSKADIAALAAARYLTDTAYGDGHGKNDGAVVALCCEPTEGLDHMGADRVLILPEEDGYQAERIALNLALMLDKVGPRHILFSDSYVMHEAAARLAALTNQQPAMRVHKFEGCACVRRGFGDAKDLMQEAPLIISTENIAAPVVSGERFEAKQLDFSSLETSVNPQIKDLGVETMPADDISLEEAPLVLSAGAGVKNWELFSSVAKRLNATRAGTRVVCDLGLIDRDRQVGASGRIVNAECYIALGISGAIQHLQGIENCEHVIAINTDATAHIMKRADFAVVGDVNDVLRALDERLKGVNP